MSKKTMVVVGAGKGMGNNIAKVFGNNGFRVILIARNQNSLDNYIKEFEDLNIETYAYSADCSEPSSLTSAFEKIQEKFNNIDVLVYNACILEAGKPTELSFDTLVKHYKVDVASALHCVQIVLSQMKARKEGTILFTGGGLALNPIADFTCISIGKAALRTLAFTLNEELKEYGIYTGIVTITGNVAPNTKYDPAIIAQEYWKLYTSKAKKEVII